MRTEDESERERRAFELYDFLMELNRKYPHVLARLQKEVPAPYPPADVQGGRRIIRAALPKR